MATKKTPSPGTQAGEFVREEIDRIRAGEHGARNTKQAIAIGLSEARRAGVKLPVPKEGTVSEATLHKAQQDTKRGQEHPNAKPSAKRSRATMKALQHESGAAVSHEALSDHAKQVARKRRATRDPAVTILKS
jgi:hypothetical protein